METMDRNAGRSRAIPDRCGARKCSSLCPHRPECATDATVSEFCMPVHRYMAPEVALSKPYSHRAEVFAFGTLVWQMLAHERPFADCDVTTFYQRVCHRGERPKIPRDTPPQLAECVAHARTQPHFPLFSLSSPRVLTCPFSPIDKQDPTAMLGGGTGAPPRALGRPAGSR